MKTIIEMKNVTRISSGDTVINALKLTNFKPWRELIAIVGTSEVVNNSLLLVLYKSHHWKYYLRQTIQDRYKGKIKNRLKKIVLFYKLKPYSVF